MWHIDSINQYRGQYILKCERKVTEFQMSRNASESKQNSIAEIPESLTETIEHLIAAEDGFYNTTSATRRKIFSILQEEKASLEARKADLKSQLDLANRRLEAHNLVESTSKPMASDPCSWLSDPKEIARMRDRLKKAAENEQLILPIVEEVREFRQRLLEQALVIYRDLATEDGYS